MRYIEYLVKEKFGTINNFAAACDIPQCTMHHYFTSLRFPNTHNFMTIADRLHISAELLYNNWYKEITIDD